MCSNRSWKRNFLCSPTSTRVESGFAVPQNTFWCPYLIAVKSIVLSAFILLVPAMPEDTPFSWNTLAFRQGKKLKCSFSFTMYFYSTWVPLHFSGFWRQENQKIEFSQGILPTFIHKRSYKRPVQILLQSNLLKPFLFIKFKMIRGQAVLETLNLLSF